MQECNPEEFKTLLNEIKAQAVILAATHASCNTCSEYMKRLRDALNLKKKGSGDTDIIILEVRDGESDTNRCSLIHDMLNVRETPTVYIVRDGRLDMIDLSNAKTLDEAIQITLKSIDSRGGWWW